MSLLFRYKLTSKPQPIWALHGRLERPRPIIHVSMTGPTGIAVRDGLLDTGADDAVFPEALANDIGIDLSNAPTGTAAGVGKVSTTLRYAEVILRVTDGKEFREWPARVGFSSAPLHRPLPGFAGFVQFFTATFHGGTEQVELTVNNIYPST